MANSSKDLDLDDQHCSGFGVLSVVYNYLQFPCSVGALRYELCEVLETATCEVDSIISNLEKKRSQYSDKEYDFITRMIYYHLGFDMPLLGSRDHIRLKLVIARLRNLINQGLTNRRRRLVAADKESVEATALTYSEAFGGVMCDSPGIIPCKCPTDKDSLTERAYKAYELNLQTETEAKVETIASFMMSQEVFDERLLNKHQLKLLRTGKRQNKISVMNQLAAKKVSLYEHFLRLDPTMDSDQAQKAWNGERKPWCVQAGIVVEGTHYPSIVSRDFLKSRIKDAEGSYHYISKTPLLEFLRNVTSICKEVFLQRAAKKDHNTSNAPQGGV